MIARAEIDALRGIVTLARQLAAAHRAHQEALQRLRAASCPAWWSTDHRPAECPDCLARAEIGREVRRLSRRRRALLGRLATEVA